MTKQDMIDLLATSAEHARKLRPFKVAQLQEFVDAQTDPKNHEEFPVGSFVYCEWSGSKGIVTATQKVPGRLDNRFNLFVKTGSTSQLHTHSGDVVRA
jgi:hypothetical protein